MQLKILKKLNSEKPVKPHKKPSQASRLSKNALNHSKLKLIATWKADIKSLDVLNWTSFSYKYSIKLLHPFEV